MSVDPYRDPSTGILRNRLGITDSDELGVAEAGLTALRLVQLGRRGLPGSYDLGHLRRFHAWIFGDVYSWAGELRTVGIAKGLPFCPPGNIESFAQDIFGRLARENQLRDRGREDFLDGLTELVSDVNALHPFREGNGRAVRAFTAALARRAGHELRWIGMDPEENVTASYAALAGDNRRLRAMLDPLVDRPDPGSTAPRPRRPT